MKVVSWNLNHWQQSRRGAAPPNEAWRYMREELEADVALVQEAQLPDDVDPADARGFAIGEGSRAWGVGIVDLTGVGIADLDPFASPDRKTRMELSWTRPEAAAAAVIGTGAGNFLAVSLYGMFAGGSSYASMLHHAADLAPLLNDFSAARRVLIAGDLNLNGQWSGADGWYNPLERTILQTFAMWDMRDLLATSDLEPAPGCRCGAVDCRHVQTYWRPADPATPWQNDHAFASSHLVVTRVRIESEAVTVLSLSDHAPIMIDVETA